MPASSSVPTAEDFEPYRRELTGYCYQMLGSGLEAEDAVQDTFVKAWAAADRFEGRSSVRSWLYRIATNVCIDMQRSVQRRARPMDLADSSPPDERYLGEVTSEALWITPIDDAKVAPDGADPAEAAEALESSVASVNSALQRARATMQTMESGGKAKALDPDDAELLERYASAFERYDIAEFVTLLRDDAVQSMPPFAMWIQGAHAIGEWMVQPGPSGCAGSRLVPVHANGLPGFAQYRPDPAGGFTPWGLHLLEISGGEVTAINTFLAMLDPERLFPSFGLANHLDD